MRQMSTGISGCPHLISVRNFVNFPAHFFSQAGKKNNINNALAPGLEQIDQFVPKQNSGMRSKNTSK
jgi:hypothetical protein